MGISRFEDIECWKLARRLNIRIYALIARSRRFAHDFGLSDQIKRAAGSAMHNIAEGFDSGTSKEFSRFLTYAKRSCTEVQSELYVALDQKYISPREFEDLYDLAEKTRAKINGFLRYLKSCN